MQTDVPVSITQRLLARLHSTPKSIICKAKCIWQEDTMITIQLDMLLAEEI